MIGSNYVRIADRAKANRVPTSYAVAGAYKSIRIRLGEGVRFVASIGGAVLLGVTASGCIATRGWVRDQTTPISGKLNNTEAKADKALAGLQNLQLERRMILDSSDGPTFAFGSPALTANAKHEIDGFMGDLQGAPDAETTSGRIFVVAGHTDSIGSEDYNYELG
jgi:outer membrane protein OmpA-like peptidoglycan-associated protein